MLHVTRCSPALMAEKLPRGLRRTVTSSPAATKGSLVVTNANWSPWMQQTEDLPNHFLSCASPTHSFMGLVARWISEINPKDLWNLSSVVPELGPDSKLRFRTHKQFASTSRKWLAATFPLSSQRRPPEVFPFATCYARLRVVSYQSKQRDVPRHVARPVRDYISQRFRMQLSVLHMEMQ